jgi:alkylation response protein AidB-like acyl-CoA dehydrogenase
MLHRYGSPTWRTRHLESLVAGDIFPSFAMTEPEVAGSDSTTLRTTAALDNGECVIPGSKWFTTYAHRIHDRAAPSRTRPPQRASHNRRADGRPGIPRCP